MARTGRQVPLETSRPIQKDVAAEYKGSQVALLQPQPYAAERWWNRQKSKPKREIFPFLNLPAEIRHLIYKYTVPDVLVERPRHRKRKKAPLRADGTKCCVALLCTNRQIYNELYHEWYSKVFFRVDIKYGMLRYLKHTVLDNDGITRRPLPSTFFQHSRISIRWKFEPYNSKSSRAREVAFLSSLATLLQPKSRRDSDSPLEELNFEYLIPNLTELRYFHQKLWNESTGIIGLIEPYLAPLRKMRGLNKVAITTSERYPLRIKSLEQHKQLEQDVDAHHWRVAKEAVDTIAEDMMSQNGWLQD